LPFKEVQQITIITTVHTDFPKYSNAESLSLIRSRELKVCIRKPQLAQHLFVLETLLGSIPLLPFTRLKQHTATKIWCPGLEDLRVKFLNSTSLAKKLFTKINSQNFLGS